MELRYYNLSDKTENYIFDRDLITSLPVKSPESYKYCTIQPQSTDDGETVLSIINLIKDSNCRIVLVNLSRLHSQLMRNAYAKVYNETLSNINFIEFVNCSIKIPYEVHLYYKPEGI